MTVSVRAVAQLGVVALAGMLAACGTGFEQSRRALWSSVLIDNHAVDAARLNSDYRYLRVTLDGHALLMVLGYVDADPAGATEVWYSSGGEVLRLRQGMVVGTTGLPVEWSAVQGLPLLDPNMLPEQAVPFTRQWSVKPGYHIDQREARSFAPLSTVPVPRALLGLPPARLRWFADSPVAGADGRGQLERRPSLYGWLRTASSWQWQYTEQCLAADFCLALQRWPVPAARSGIGAP